MNVLGIETSCDETAAAVVADGHCVLANVVSSQIAQHAAYGGVIPELAARQHLEAIGITATRALDIAGLKAREIDAVAVTASPGLLPALLVGLSFAKGLAASLSKPFIGIDHFVAHIFAVFLEQADLLEQCRKLSPMVALVVSGGHTALVLVENDGASRIIGQTLDDAAGEAFDKGAKILQLPYPGGPVIEQLARHGNPEKYRFPRALTGATGAEPNPENRFNFSFSGVKTSLLYHLRNRFSEPDRWCALLAALPTVNGVPTPAAGASPDPMLQDLLDTIASYQEAIVDVLVHKAIAAAGAFDAGAVILCGGVACNGRLRAKAMHAAQTAALPLHIAAPRYCTDNAAMIAGLAYYQLRAGLESSLGLDAATRLRFSEPIPFTGRC